MDTQQIEASQKLIDTALAMNDRGINQGTSGNVSLRFNDGFLLTPSSVAYDQLCPKDIVFMSLSGAWKVLNDRRPSSEWRIHRDIYAKRLDAEAIVHAHPINATALAVHSRGIGPFHYMVAIAGGRDIRCARYETFGSQELSEAALEALVDRKACLLAHHGIVALGKNLDQALAIAIEVEVLAGQYLQACQLGVPPELSNTQIDAVLAKISAGQGYGASALSDRNQT